MHDQADQLRKLVRDVVDQHGDLAPGAPVLVVSGAQVAAGATTIACGLARELASLGKHVALIDANFAAPTIADRFQINPLGSLAEVLAGRRRAIEVLVTSNEGVRVLASSEPTPAPQLNAEALTHFDSELAAICRQSDVVLIDAGAGMNPWVDRLWQIAQHVLLVAAPHSAAMLDAYAALKQSHHDRSAGKLQLVITRCDAGVDAARLHAGFADTVNRFLGHAIQPPAVLPTIAPDDAQPYERSLRLLAADLARDFRAISTRLANRTTKTTLQLPPSRLARSPRRPGEAHTTPANHHPTPDS